MITREEAAALESRVVFDGPEIRIRAEDAIKFPALARTVVALYDDLAAAQDRSDVEQEALRMATLELRRLRAAEAPGTDDEAFSGTGWASSGAQAWVHESGAYIAINIMGSWVWSFGPNATDYLTFAIALDAMRAAVPGSV